MKWESLLKAKRAIIGLEARQEEDLDAEIDSYTTPAGTQHRSCLPAPLIKAVDQRTGPGREVYP